MADKVIRADTKRRDIKTFNTISMIAILFIVLTAGFMVFQNLQLTEELSDKEVVATAFAEGIQTMCSEDMIQDKYSRMCSIAENYAERSDVLDPNKVPDSAPPREITDISCSDDKTTIKYSDGSVAETNAKCDTTN